MSVNVQTAQAVEEKKNVTVQIFGSEYPIAGAKDAKYMEELACFVDGHMRDIAKGSALLSSGKLAVLAALNMADELFRLRTRHEKLREKVLRHIAEISKKIDNFL